MAYLPNIRHGSKKIDATQKQQELFLFLVLKSRLLPIDIKALFSIWNVRVWCLISRIAITGMKLTPKSLITRSIESWAFHGLGPYRFSSTQGIRNFPHQMLSVVPWDNPGVRLALRRHRSYPGIPGKSIRIITHWCEICGWVCLFWWWR